MKFIKTLLFCTISLFANGQHWFPVGGGINSGYAELFAFEDKLFAGGFFTNIDGVTARGLAYWDDKKWKSFALDSLPYSGVRTFTNYKDELYAFGNNISLNHGNILKYIKPENTWISIPNSKVYTSSNNFPNQYGPGYVNFAIEFQNELYISGNFDRIGDKNLTNFAKWNGSEWGSITNNTGTELLVQYISNLTIFNNEIIAWGRLSDINFTESYTGFLIWDGDTWSNLEGEIIPNLSSPPSFDIWDIEVYQNDLYVAGSRLKIPGSEQAYALIKWDGNTWQGIQGFDSNLIEVRSLKKFGNYLAIGGIAKDLNENLYLGISFLYNGVKIKKLEGDQSFAIKNFTEFNKQLYIGTDQINTPFPINIGVYRLGSINLDTEEFPSYNFFPNPTQGEFMISYEALENTSTIISFYNVSGILVHEEIFNDLKGPYLRRFNLQELHSGIYIVQIQSKGINESKMIMKN